MCEWRRSSGSGLASSSPISTIRLLLLPDADPIDANNNNNNNKHNTQTTQSEQHNKRN